MGSSWPRGYELTDLAERATWYHTNDYDLVVWSGYLLSATTLRPIFPWYLSWRTAKPSHRAGQGGPWP